MAQLGYSDLGNTITVGGYPATTTPVTTATSPDAAGPRLSDDKRERIGARR